MLIHPTVERLRALGLTAMANAFIELQKRPQCRGADPGERRPRIHDVAQHSDLISLGVPKK